MGQHECKHGRWNYIWCDDEVITITEDDEDIKKLIIELENYCRKCNWTIMVFMLNNEKSSKKCKFRTRDEMWKRNRGFEMEKGWTAKWHTRCGDKF